MLPLLTNAACGVGPIRAQREKVVPLARGDVLEIGMGTGLNLPYYNSANITRLWGLEPAAEMRAKASKVAATVDFPVTFLDHPGEDVPLADNSVDTVLVTYALCTIPDALAALAQMRRVLRPNGQLIFCEHGQAPDPKVRRFQNWLNPVWGRFSGGCHLNRPIDALVNSAGFDIDVLNCGYIPGPKFASYNYWGTAKVSP